MLDHPWLLIWDTMVLANTVVQGYKVNIFKMWLQVKHLQFLSGIHPSSYWLASYAWDLLNTLLPIVITVIIFAAFRVDAFRSSSVLGAIFILLVVISVSLIPDARITLHIFHIQLLAVWAGIPISYMASFLFSNAFTASGIVNLMFIFSAIVNLL